MKNIKEWLVLIMSFLVVNYIISKFANAYLGFLLGTTGIGALLPALVIWMLGLVIAYNLTRLIFSK